MKKEIRKAVSALCPGVKIKFDKQDNPTIIVPDDKEKQARKIMRTVTSIFKQYGWLVKFDMSKARKV